MNEDVPIKMNEKLDNQRTSILCHVSVFRGKPHQFRHKMLEICIKAADGYLTSSN